MSMRVDEVGDPASKAGIALLRSSAKIHDAARICGARDPSS